MRKVSIVLALVLVNVNAIAIGGCTDSTAPSGPERAPNAEVPAPAAPRIVLRAYDDPGDAVKALLADSQARVLGVGEIHQSQAQAAVPSAIERFGQGMIEAMKGRAADLLVETWVSEGGCGETEKQVVKQVEQTTERPPETENEIVTLLRRAKGLGIRPHILQASCKDYAVISGGEGGVVDYEKLLRLTTDKLRESTLAVLDAEDRPTPAPDAGAAGAAPTAPTAPPAPTGKKPGMLVVYGGAVHNDAAPEDGLEVFTYAPAVRDRVKGRYAEVDLWVPEFVADDPEITGSAAYQKALTRLDENKTLLLTLGKGRYVIVFPRSKPPLP